jgi:hypothetical protein
MTANCDCQHVLASRWLQTASGPFFEIAEPPQEFLEPLPADYLAAVAVFGGREGFLGRAYLRLYRLQELLALNIAYEVPSLLPEVIIFGSDGVGQGFAFQLGEAAVVRVPFLPLGPEHADLVARSFTEFVQSLADSGESAPYNPEAVGMEVHDKHPICLGGNPTDPANKVLVPPAKHAEICRFWNKVYRDAVSRQRGSAEQSVAAESSTTG